VENEGPTSLNLKESERSHYKQQLKEDYKKELEQQIQQQKSQKVLPREKEYAPTSLPLGEERVEKDAQEELMQ